MQDGEINARKTDQQYLLVSLDASMLRLSLEIELSERVLLEWLILVSMQLVLAHSEVKWFIICYVQSM